MQQSSSTPPPLCPSPSTPTDATQDKPPSTSVPQALLRPIASETEISRSTSSERDQSSETENADEVASSSHSQRVVSPAGTSERFQAKALNETLIAVHLERYLLARDNRERSFVYSSVTNGANVYCFAPSVELKRNYWTLVTMGMSGTAMNVPRNVARSKRFAHAELLCYLPPIWQFPPSLSGDINEQNWPIEMLRSLARYVVMSHAWLGQDHGVPNLLSTPPGQPFVPSSKLSHVILLSPVNEPESFVHVDVGTKCVNFYVVVPITAKEAQWKRDMGAERSIYFVVGSHTQAGDDVFIDYVIDPLRPCAVEDLNCRDIFNMPPGEHVRSEDNAGEGQEPSDDEENYGEFAELDDSSSDGVEDGDGEPEASESNSGRTEPCSEQSSSDTSSRDSDEFVYNKRTRFS